VEHKEEAYEIHGVVTGKHGEPLHGARVVVWRQHIRERHELAAGQTNEDGRYHLRYEVPSEAGAPILILVEALSEYLDSPLYSQLTNAAADLEIDLHLDPKDQSEWATLLRALEPLLEGIPLAELVENSTHQDISFLAQELRKDTETIMRVAVAARLEQAFKVPAPAFYAFLRQHVPAALPSPLLDASQNFTLIDPLVQRIGSLIFALSAQIETTTLTAAISLDLIGTQYTKDIPAWVNDLETMHTTDLLNQPYLVGNTTLGQILSVTGLSTAKQQAFAKALATSAQSMRNFWRGLAGGQQGFTAAEASAIERTLTVGAFVKNHLPLVQALMNGFSAGTYKTLPDLARLSLQDWEQLVNQTGPPPGIDAAGAATPAQVFAAVVYTRVTRVYPTAALSGRIAGTAIVAPPQQKPLLQFFQNNPDLELVKDNLTAYLKTAGGQAFAGIDVQDRPAVVANARSFQRVLRVAPHVDVAQNLLVQGIKSATQIATLGEQQFFNRATAAGLTKPEANQVYRAAAQRYASLVSLYLRLNTDSLGILPGAMNQVSEWNGLAQQAIERDPSLAVLFGSQDYCATDDCTSVLSPAAYLCDLLLWLRNHQQAGYTALDILDARRPDIRHLLLNCPNTDTELPYIDLVNELLADKINPPVDATSTSFIQKVLADGTTYYYIVTAVNALGESNPSAQVSASPAAPATAPAAPAGAAATAGNTQVTLTWNAVAEASSYNVYWSTNAGVTPGNGTQIAGAVSPLVQTGLSNGTTYYYVVTAVNALGESAPSAQVSAAPAAPIATPGAPTGLAASSGDGQVLISWNPVAGAASYNLYWSTNAGFTPATGTQIPGATSPYTQTTLVDGTTYYYLVTAVNAVGESAPSAEASATPAQPIVVPAAPAGVTALAGDCEVTLSWDAVQGATSYNIYWSTSAGVTTTNGTQITGARNPKWKQTSANKTATDLAAAPEYFNQGAYSVLFGANYPFSLPYSAGLDELQTYLRQWNLPLWQLRYSVLPFGGGSVAQRAAVGAARFGMPPHAVDLVTNANFVPLNVAWNTGAQDPTLALAPVSPPTVNTAQMAFLPAASITYEQLLELLQVSWVQGGVNVAIQGINDSCNTSAESLAPTPLDPGFLDRAQRFLRLWNKTGYKMWELDLLLQSPAVANGTLDAAGLAALLSFQQLQDATRLSVDQLLAFYGNIDTATHRVPDGSTTASLYGQTFLNPTVTSVAPDPDLDVLPFGGTPADLNLSDHLAALQSALGLSAGDTATLIGLTSTVNTSLSTEIAAAQTPIDVVSDAGFPAPNFTVNIGSEVLLVTGVSGVGNTTWTVLRGQNGTTAAPAANGTIVGFNVLTLANLSLMYRVALLATTSKLSITNLIAIAQLLNPGAASPAAALAPLFASPAATVAFLAQAQAIQQAGLSLDALTYLLTPPIATTLATPIDNVVTTVTVASNSGFPAPDFYISIGSEVLQVTAVSGPGNTVWTVLRAQQGTTAAGAVGGAAVALTSGWLTSTQMTPANIATTLAAVQQAVQSLPTTLSSPIAPADTTLTVASSKQFPLPNFYVSIGSEVLLVTALGGTNNTTWTVTRAQQGTAAAAAAAGSPVTPFPAITKLTANIAAKDTTLSVASDAAFPAPPFYIALGSEILQVTAVGGGGNTTWTVVRGQQNTTAATATSGAVITPAGANLYGTIVAAVASNAHTATSAALTNSVSAVILTTLQVPGTTQTLLAVLGDPAFTSSAVPLAPVSFPSQYLAVQLFDKVAVLVRGLQLVAADLTWLIANGPAYGGLDFTQLPVTSAQATSSLANLLSTLLLIKLERLWNSAHAAPPSSAVQTLYDVIGAVAAGGFSESQAQSALATITGWPAADIASFARALGLTYPANYLQPAAYDALRTLEAMAITAGASAMQLVAWAAVPPDEPTAESLAAGTLGVLKAQQPSSDAWVALAPTVMNPIRERRAAALQAWLIGQRDGSSNLIYGDTNGLFDYFLIDTQMSSCQVTSRVVQAYIAVQIFVERCLMNLEAPAINVDPNQDETWNWWNWMSRYRIWEANREVFLYPENWLIESQRPNRTEIYQKLEQEVRQGESTTDYLETVVLNYIDRLDGLAHLLVTGTYQDPATGDIYVVARTQADPPVFYYRTYSSANDTWNGWIQIPLDIKAHQVVPSLYRGRLCLFWMEVKVSNEPSQSVPPAQASSSPPSQQADRYVSIGVYFSIFRNNAWAPAQSAKGKLFDKPFFDNTSTPNDARTVAALYTIKVQAQNPQPGYGTTLFVDIFRLGNFQLVNNITIFFVTISFGQPVVDGIDNSVAVHLGRAVFDGRFADLELQNFDVAGQFLGQLEGTNYDYSVPLLSHAQSTYGPDAQPLLPLTAPDPNLTSEPGAVPLVPMAGALSTGPADPTQGSPQNTVLAFTSVDALEQNVGRLLNQAQVPFRVIGPVSDLGFDPASYFFFQDNRRSYYVQTQKYYATGSAWSPVVPSNPASAPYEVRYQFHPFYHPFTGLFWNQLAGGGFDLFYDPNLQQNPDQIDNSGSDVFSFGTNYQPSWRVWWDHDDVTGADRQFLNFALDSSFGVYNWELFYHIPIYIAQLLSQNQQFQDAQSWFHYVFNPTLQGSDPVPQRFWIPKPLHNLTPAQVLGQQINALLQAVNFGDPTALQQVAKWQADPFDPFLLADLRLGVPYMKYTVMSYLDNVIAWGDNLFSTQSREALSEATLLYVIAAEMLGPTPTAVTPPQHADESFDQLEAKLDAFANALVEIENVIGGAGAAGGSGSGAANGGIPPLQTFYFKIPTNEKLLGYWSTVADRLYKLRHCQSITGAPLQLALFDAPIDPGLLIAAQAAGVDLSSVLSNIFAPLPSYRFTSLYPVALDFVNAVRAYGASLQAALEKSDSGALSLLQQTTQQQLLIDGNQVLDWQVQQAEQNLAAAQESYNLAQQKYSFNTTQGFMNAAEVIALGLETTAIVLNGIAGFAHGTAAVAHAFPDITIGVQGFGGTAVAIVKDGGGNAGAAAGEGGKTLGALAAIADKSSGLAKTLGDMWNRQTNWNEAGAEAKIQMNQANDQIAAAQLALQIAQQNQTLHQEQIDDLQKQIDFLNNKFTNDGLYDWMASSLSATYFQSYQLAYQMCKAVERCYQYELGAQGTSFIQFGYWDNLYKGLLAGESLNHDLRRMEASYFQENARRFEISRFVSLGILDATALQALLVNGTCTFNLPESLFDNDYPGHYNRRLTRVSMTVVYPNPGKFDNIKATLTMVSNKVRISTDTSAGYVETNSDPRFVYNYAAVPQKIAMGNAQDDPGLFLTTLSNNLSDQRYLPFENAGAISKWSLEMQQSCNEVDLSGVGDVILHLYYTALDGGNPLKTAASQYYTANPPSAGLKVFSAQNDFVAPPTSGANPHPVAPWQGFLFPPTAGADQVLTLPIFASKFPAWTRGKTITVTSLSVLAIAWPTNTNFVIVPQAPLPTNPIPMTPVAGVSEPVVLSAPILTPGTVPATWSFKIQQQNAGNFTSLTPDTIGDVLLMVTYSAN